MVKVFLVEDEVVIRNGIKNGIQWEKEGLRFVGEASDGELAYPLIKKHKPDILITDIKMPFMDGFELSKAVLRDLPETKVMILSGYGEFKYAQEALRMGVQEYLLKPVSSVKLLEAIKGIVAVIEKEQKEKELIRQYSKEMEESFQRKIQDFFNQLVTEQFSITEALALGHQLGIDLSAENYNIILFKIRQKDHEIEYSEQVVEVTEKIWHYVHTQNNVYAYERGAEGLAFLIKGNGEKELERYIRMFRDYLVGLVSPYENVEYYAGVGKIVSRVREIKDSYNEANRVFAGRFAGRWNRFVMQEESDSQIIADFDIQTVYPVEDTRKMIQRFLRTGTKEEIKSFVKGYFANISQENLKSLMMRQYICMDLYFSVISFGDELQFNKEEMIEACGEFKDLNDYIVTFEKTEAYLYNLLDTALLVRDSAAGRKYSDILIKAKSYIQENYMQEDMSLNKLASHVNMSPSYFSAIFSQESGKTFVEYLTEVRMEKAKDLLMCSNQKTSEIGYKVGYKDSHYFNYIFKKTQKCSPREYRLRGKSKYSKQS